MTDESYTYWSAAEMRKVRVWTRNGESVEAIAAALGRTVGAVRSRLYYMRVAELAAHQDDNATIHTLKREEKEDAKQSKSITAANDYESTVPKTGRVHIH